MSKFRIQIAVGCLMLAALPVSAALHDRGGGLIYDDVLDVTWLQDAAYQVTTNAPNVDANGRMTWRDAVVWTNSLVYYDSVRNVNWADWRLPRVSPVNEAVFDINNSFDGSTDNGWNITSPASELSYMYHVNLGNLSLYDTEGNFGQPGYGLKNTGPFTGLSGGIWTMIDHPVDPNQAFILGMGNGHQDFFTKDTSHYVWAVRDGDVATVPDGDLNGDSLVNAADVLIGFRILSGDVIATPEQLQRGDVAPLVGGGQPSPDGLIGIGDILSIQRKSQGLVSFP